MSDTDLPVGVKLQGFKNGPPFLAKDAHFPFLPQRTPDILSDKDQLYKVILQRLWDMFVYITCTLRYSHL